MELHARAPEQLQKKPPMDKTWRLWKEEFITFMKASGYIKQSDESKAHLLMNLMGRVGQEALQNMETENPGDSEDMDKLIEKFDMYFDPPKQEVEERLNFFRREKKENEKMEDYINELKVLAKTCNFGDQVEALIRDMVVFHTYDKMLRKLFLAEKNLDFGKIIMIYDNYELNKERIKQVIDTKPEGPFEFKSACKKCGRKHPYKQCPAFGKKCESCQGMNHFKNLCPAKFQAPENLNNQPKQQNEKLDKNLAGPFKQIDKANKIMNMQCKNVLASNTDTTAQSSNAVENSSATKNVDLMPPSKFVAPHNSESGDSGQKSNNETFVHLPRPEDMTYHRYRTIPSRSVTSEFPRHNTRKQKKDDDCAIL